MGNEILDSQMHSLEAYCNDVCRNYGVSCKIVSANKYVFTDEQERYLVFGVHGVPDSLNVKDIYVRNERSNSLFYTDYFVVKIDENTTKLGVVEAAVSYCKTVEFLKKLFDEHKTPLPLRIRGDEIGGLKEYNSGRNNRALPPEVRAKFSNGLKKFFKQERTRSKYLQKWRAFSRTDKFDRKAPTWKMFLDFHKRNSQITDLDLLHETNDDLKSTVINEHEFVKFKEDMKRLFPDVLYSVSKVEVQNEGFNRHNRNKPIHKIPAGPYGKLITYQAYCEELEKRFAQEGYEAVKDLNPAYYETRQLTYKEIDEPYIASVLNTIRFAYAKGNSLEAVKTPGIDVVSFIDIPISDMMNFVSLAKANNVSFYLDCFGKFGKANLESIRVVYNPKNDEMMNLIFRRMVDEKVELSHIVTTMDQDGPSLENKISQAQHLLLSVPGRHSLNHDTKHIEL